MKSLLKIHEFIVRNAEKIAVLAKAETKSRAATEFGISIGGVDTALWLNGDQDFCAPSFRARMNHEPKTAKPQGTGIPDFDKMAGFLLGVIAKAEAANTILEENKKLQEQAISLREENRILSRDCGALKELKLKWEVMARGSQVTHGD